MLLQCPNVKSKSKREKKINKWIGWLVHHLDIEALKYHGNVCVPVFITPTFHWNAIQYKILSSLLFFFDFIPLSHLKRW